MNQNTTESKPVERKEYTLKEPLIQGGEDKKAGDKVKLRPDQAKKLGLA